MRRCAAQEAATIRNADHVQNMTIRQALKISKKAVLWSLVISTCVIMEGYDTNLLGNFYGESINRYFPRARLTFDSIRKARFLAEY